MNLGDSFKLAFQNLRHRQMRSWLTLIGIFAGIAAVVALISLGQGLQDAVNDQFNSLGTNKFNVQGAGAGFGPPGTNAVGKLTDHDIRLLERIQGVKTVAGRYFKPGTMAYQDKTEAIFISSIPYGKEKAKLTMSIYNYDIAEGRIITEKDNGKIFIGSKMADFDGKQIQSGQKVLINDETFTVIGVGNKKGNPIFDGSVLMTESDLDKLVGLNGNYNLIGVEIDPKYNLDEIVKLTEDRMRRDRGLNVGEEDFEISTPQEFLDSVNSILLTIQILLVGIAAISLLVGAIGIANTMYTAVLERNKEIGIMKAIGARNNEILRIFLIESGLLGLAGGLLGLLIGMGIAKGVELGAYIAFGESIIKASFPWALIVGSLLFAFILGAVSGTLPARQAAKLRPADALRK